MADWRAFLSHSSEAAVLRGASSASRVGRIVEACCFEVRLDEVWA